MSYSRFVAEGPTCGQWPANVGDDKRNLPYHDFGCSTQRNFAAQIANPADLLGPRTMTAAPGERRDQVWDKWTKGESTIAEKKADERSQVKGSQ
jgi:pilus assembly protein CpaD